MNISTNNNEDIKVGIYPQPKKQKSDASQYDIYLLFTISQKGITQASTSISTGITVEKNAWGKKEMKGKNERAQIINNKLNEYMRIADIQLTNIASEQGTGNVFICSQIKDAILIQLKQKLLEKPPLN